MNQRYFTTILCLISFLHASIVCAAPSPNVSSSFLSQWIQSRDTGIPTKAGKEHHGEIWSRVRGQFNIKAPTSAPLFQRHLKEYARSQTQINKLFNNASPYFYYILEEVEKRGMPSEIALLPMIESEFNPFNISHKGALGLWQIMPSLGRLYGLKQNSVYDGRKDIYESTKVALDHLEYLHKKFGGNWLLALAAYNSGESRVLKAIQKNKALRKPTDYWSLNLPKETKNYVPKLLALVSIVKSPKQYGVTLPSIPNKPVFTRISTTKGIDIARAAKLADVSEMQLRKLNPGFKKTANPTGPFNLVVPIHRADTLKQKIPAIPTPVVAPKAKKSKAKITTAKATAQPTLKQNHKASKDVQTKKATTVAVATTTKGKKIHVVKKGESIPKIARKHKISTSTLLAKNNLKSISSIIQPGQKLIVG